MQGLSRLKVRVKVRFGSGNPENRDDFLVIYTTARPEKNLANLDVIKQLAKFYGAKPERIHLTEGRKSRTKTFIIEDGKNES